MDAIAVSLGASRRTVRCWLNDLDIPIRSRRGVAIADRERVLLEELYGTLGLSTHEIAGLLNLSRGQVTRRLRQLGIPVRHRGRGGTRRRSPLVSRELLEELYLGQRLTVEEVATWTGVSPSKVKASLRAHQVPIRTRGRCNREDRRRVSRPLLEFFYVDRGWSADDIGRMLGVSRNVVLRAAHDHGLAVRAGGTRGTRTTRIELLKALYDDPRVEDALRRHGVPKRAVAGTVSQRFPVPAPLTPELLRELYEDEGLSARHIELLTGQPSETVRRRLRDLRIPLRGRGGHAPIAARLFRNPE